jgi:hypothetical protein
MLRTALQLAARGIHVFPVAQASKVPACALGCRAATTDPIVIQRWWKGNPHYNIGIATGPASGVFVVDIDGEDGEFSLRKLEEAHGPLPNTVESITGSGRHAFFQYPPISVRNSAGKLGIGIDMRGDGGFVVAPPSLHPSGRRYCWSVDSANAFAEAPGWLVDKIAEPKKKNGNGNGATPPSEWRALVANGLEEGCRNNSLTRLTGHLLRRYVDPNVTLQLVQSFNQTHCRPPLGPEDVQKLVNSIAGREIKRRANGH